uniref:NADH-ubiquinone oxidoreductase chain 4 n=1 Tax=Lissemys punctata TaxID=55542 RepID=B6RAK6_9SAUR|nr:NADH dehydrogenase subunit 4 [Lissemys punctata]ABK41359.1 NADH dehydrogenase subunit 4 [Lissemys punctata]
MLKILLPTIMLIPTVTMCKPTNLWYTSLTHTLLISLLSLKLLNYTQQPVMIMSNPYLATDQISTPLIILTCWLTPLMIIASQNHMSTEPLPRKRIFTITIVLLQTLLIMTFSTTNLMLFFITFEATLVPTLMMITRWGNQMERLNAGTYFMLYTLIGSLPLLVALLSLHSHTSSLFMPVLQLNPPTMTNTWTNSMWLLAVLTAFTQSMPLYGLHLWLPKAHVEAPIAGSMILAAILLKLGGYGIIRIMLTTNFMSKTLYYPFIILGLWGIIMTSLICLRQTDLKSLIAYSSVSHMGLITAATLTQTEWAYTGTIILMIAHGLTSSMLFCLANMNYERIHSRTLLMAQNMQTLLPLMGTWWLLASLTNMALPPSINLMGELTIITSMFIWSPPTILITAIGTLITAMYTLHMFSTTQWGPHLTHMKSTSPSHTREHLTITLHILPSILLMTKPEPIWGYFY